MDQALRDHNLMLKGVQGQIRMLHIEDGTEYGEYQDAQDPLTDQYNMEDMGFDGQDEMMEEHEYEEERASEEPAAPQEEGGLPGQEGVRLSNAQFNHMVQGMGGPAGVLEAMQGAGYAGGMGYGGRSMPGAAGARRRLKLTSPALRMPNGKPGFGPGKGSFRTF